MPYSTQRTPSPQLLQSLRKAGIPQGYERLEGTPKTAHTRSITDGLKQPDILRLRSLLILLTTFPSLYHLTLLINEH